MADAGLDIEGLDEARASLEALADGDFDADSDTWWIGTVVRYAPFLEFGTVKMVAKPFFRPAVQRVKRWWGAGGAMGGISNRLERQMTFTLDAMAEVTLEQVAFRLEREVKNLIKTKGLIDTGNLRDSIAAAPSKDLMDRASQVRLQDPETSLV